MQDLVQWLRNRLDEEAALAEGASPGPWRQGEEYDEVLAGDGITVAEGFALSGRQLRATVDHISRHDPTRVLREIGAKRQLLDLHGLVHRDLIWVDENSEERTAEIPVCGHCVPRHSSFPHPSAVPQGPCTTLRLLALPYADRHGYRPDWRP